MNISPTTHQKKIHDYFEGIAREYKSYRRKFNYYYNDLVKYCNYFIHPDNSVLEIGCSTGQTISKIKGSYKAGIDFSETMIAEAKINCPSVDFYVMNAEEITIDQKFDVIIISNVIGYLENVQDVLLQIRKVSHPQTRIIITHYNYLWESLLHFAEFIGLKKKSPQQNWLSRKDITNLLMLANFDTYRESKRMLIPVNIPLLSWLFNKYIAQLPLIKHLCLSQFVFARPVLLPQENNQESQYSTTIVIPARNEAGNIENAILRLPQFGSKQEIIFVEGNSTDNTWEVIQQIKEKYSHSHNIVITQQEGKGKGDAVRKGYSIATGDILMILDADLTVPPEELPKFYNAIATGKAEFINGSRLVYPMDDNAMQFLNTLGNKFFGAAFSWLIQQPIKDSLCGTKVMFRKDYEKLVQNRSFFGEFDPFGDFDLLFGAYKLNLKIIDLPIRYRERVYGSTNISRFKHGIMLLRMCWFALWKVKFI